MMAFGDNKEETVTLEDGELLLCFTKAACSCGDLMSSATYKLRSKEASCHSELTPGLLLP